MTHIHAIKDNKETIMVNPDIIPIYLTESKYNEFMILPPFSSTSTLYTVQRDII